MQVPIKQLEGRTGHKVSATSTLSSMRGTRGEDCGHW